MNCGIESCNLDILLFAVYTGNEVVESEVYNSLHEDSILFICSARVIFFFALTMLLEYEH